MLLISSVSDTDSISIFIVPYGKEGLQYSSQHTIDLRHEKTKLWLCIRIIIKTLSVSTLSEKMGR